MTDHPPAPKRVILASPYAGDRERNVTYARECLRDSLLRGEAPLASHLLYTQRNVLDDSLPAERELGIVSGLAWIRAAAALVVYVDLGVSDGMRREIAAAVEAGIGLYYRRIR